MGEEQWDRLTEASRLALYTWLPPKSGLPKLAEESAELAAAANQYACGKIGSNALASEMADVIFMINEVCLLLPTAALAQAIEFKLARLIERLGEARANCTLCGGGSSVRRPCEGCMPGAFLGAEEPLPTPHEPTDEKLHEIFRDFADGQGVTDWRRKVYERCVREHLFLRER